MLSTDKQTREKRYTQQKKNDLKEEFHPKKTPEKPCVMSGRSAFHITFGDLVTSKDGWSDSLTKVGEGAFVTKIECQVPVMPEAGKGLKDLTLHYSDGHVARQSPITGAEMNTSFVCYKGVTLECKHGFSSVDFSLSTSTSYLWWKTTLVTGVGATSATASTRSRAVGARVISAEDGVRGVKVFYSTVAGGSLVADRPEVTELKDSECERRNDHDGTENGNDGECKGDGEASRDITTTVTTTTSTEARARSDQLGNDSDNPLMDVLQIKQDMDEDEPNLVSTSDLVVIGIFICIVFSVFRTLRKLKKNEI